MKTRRFWLSLAALAWIGSVPAPAQTIKYEKYKLDNGLTVILHEDHSLPVACINMWYRVGSKDEKAGRSGFAHLFEHLMFMGTRRVPEGAFDAIMEGGGGANNASTSTDRTNYFSSGPSNLLPTLLWLDADRLEDLGRSMTADKLDKQRDVVRNERRQSYENQPYGKAYLKIPEIMYPPEHPYHWPVIGSHEDLEAAGVEDVKRFFDDYYVPVNASLVVAGDFDSSRIKPLIADWFGTLPARPAPQHRSAPPLRLERAQRLTLADRVQFAKVMMVYHSPAHFADGDAEMDLLAALLTSGKSSRLYKRLVYDDKTAVDVSADQDSSQLGSLFQIEATARPGVEPATLERSIDEEIGRLLEEGVSAEELDRHKAAVETRMLAGLQRIQAVADRLNLYEHYLGEPDSFKADLDRYRRATPQSVRHWAARVLVPDQRLIVRVLPEAEQAVASSRDRQPDIGAAGDFLPAEPQTFSLGNGIKVHVWPRHELPLVSVLLLVKGGAAQDGPTRAGLAALTADMLDEGTGELGALAFSDAMEALGATFGAAADYESCAVSLFVLKRNLDRALSLYADAIQRPTLATDEWERVKGLHIEEIKQALDNPSAVAGLVAARAFFGDDHPYGRPDEGTVETVGSLSLEDVRRFHVGLYRPENATLFVAGDLTLEEARSGLERAFGGWKADPSVARLTLPVYASAGGDRLRVYLVDRPGAVQTVVRFIMPAPTYASPQRVSLRLLNTIFGGSFTSRLNSNLREQHGYTYGARSSFNLNPSVGYCAAGAAVQTPVTGAALNEFFKEFGRIRGGDISAEEASKARATVRTAVVESFAGLSGMLNTAATLTLNGLPFSTLGDDLKQMTSLDAGTMNALAREALPLEQGVLILVGDRSAVVQQAKEIGLTIDGELTVTGDRVSGADGAAGASR